MYDKYGNFILVAPRTSQFSREAKLDRMFAFGAIHGEGDGGASGDGEGEGDDEPITMTKAELEAKIEEATKPFAGLSQKNKELLEKNKGFKSALSKIDGVDVDALLTLKETVENDEILSLLAEGKHSEALDKQTERLTVNHNAALEEVTGKLTKAQEAHEADRSQLHSLLIDGEAMKHFIDAKGVKEAIPDAILRAKQVFKVERNEETGKNEVVARDASGDLIQGEKGVLTFSEFMESLKKDAPHFFPASEGGLAGDGTGSGSEGFTGSDAELMAATAKGPDALRAYKQKLAEAKKKR